jgi:hypothetical protein
VEGACLNGVEKVQWAARPGTAVFLTLGNFTSAGLAARARSVLDVFSFQPHQFF